MSWKRELKLTDLDDGQDIELTCTKCGITRYMSKERLLGLDDITHSYLDEVETRLRCDTRRCKAPMRLALLHEDKAEGFVGGMP